jgi:hypothetical protein
VAEPESFAGGGGHFHALVVDGNNGVDRRPFVERDDHVDSGGHLREGQQQRAVSHLARERLDFVGSDDDLGAEAAGGPDEVGRPVGRRRQQEENARHGPIMTA